MHEPWGLIFFCLWIAVWQGVVAIRVGLARRNSRSRQPRPQITGRSLLIGQLILAVGIAWFAREGNWTTAEFGIHQDTNHCLALGLGLIAYLIFWATLTVAAYASGISERMEDASFEVMRLIWPRETNQKRMAWIAVCIFNPVTEELVYRGVIVFAIGQELDSIVASSALGLLLSLMAHVYQGRLLMLFHFLFHSAAIGILLSPAGLVGAIGFHFAADLLPVVTMRRDMVRWAKRRRANLSVA